MTANALRSLVPSLPQAVRHTFEMDRTDGPEVSVLTTEHERGVVEPGMQPEDYDEPIRLLREAVDDGSATHEKADALYLLGCALYGRFFVSDSDLDIEEAIRRQEEALELCPDSPDMPKRLRAFGVALSSRFEAFGNLADLDSAIAHHRRAVELLVDNDPVKPVYLGCTGLLSWLRFDSSHDIADLMTVVASWKQATQLMSPRPTKPASFEADFFARFDDACASGMLPSSIAALAKYATSSALDSAYSSSPAHELVPTSGHVAPLEAFRDDQSDIEELVDRFLRYLLYRFQDVNVWNRESKSGVLSDTILVCRCAESLVPDVHPAKASMLNNLGAALMHNFEATPRAEVLDEALVLFRRGFEYPNSDIVLYFQNLSHVLLRGFHHLDTSRLDNPRQLLSNLRTVVHQLSDEDREKAGCLQQIGKLYLASFDRLKYRSDIDAAVQALEAAWKLSETQPVLVALASCLIRRFEYFSVLDDVSRAIGLLRELISRARCDVHYNLRSLFWVCRDISTAYAVLFFQYKNRSNLDLALRHCRRAVILHPGSGSALCSLANLYEQRFLQPGGDVGDLEEAIRILQHYANRLKAAPRDTTPNADADDREPNVYGILARCFATLYDHSHEASHREEAIKAYYDSLEHMHEDHRYRLMALNNLVTTLWGWDKLSDPALPYIMDIARQSLNVDGPIAEKYNAARMYAMICFARSVYADDPVKLLDALQRVITLIPQVAWLGHNISRRYGEMARLSTDVAFAVGTAADYADGRALTWFEQGRTLVWAQIRSLRTRGDQLRPKARLETFIELKRWTSERPAPAWFRSGPTVIHEPETVLDHSGVSSDISVYEKKLQAVSAALEEAGRGHTDASRTRRLAEEHAELLDIIRGHPGFERFMAPLDAADLLRASQGRTIVCINMHDAVSCRAIIVASFDGGAASVYKRLDGLSISKAQEWRKTLNMTFGLEPARQAVPRKRRRGDIRSVLRELWDVVVQPILHVLGIRTDIFPSTEDHLRRVTWCTTGALAFLPLHAAGPYKTNDVLPSAFDLIVSSYTPNITSLLSVPKSAAQATRPQVLVVAQPDAPEVSRLPGARKEAESVRRLFGTSATSLEGAAGTIDEVLAKMETHPYVHLACHGEQDPEDPLKSSFILADGKLTLERLMASTSDVAEFAFLSACETATGDEKVPEEAVHLAAGMLAVGYRSVVATMWSIGDNQAPLVAETFYTTLLAQHERGDPIDVALALHRAVKKVKEELKKTHIEEEQFVRWLPYVHFGV